MAAVLRLRGVLDHARGHLRALVLAAPVAACGHPRELPPRAAVTLAHADALAYADARVGTYVSSDWGFSTSSYWIEGPTGVVLIEMERQAGAAPAP